MTRTNYTPIQEGSQATPGLWNAIFSALSADLDVVLSTTTSTFSSDISSSGAVYAITGMSITSGPLRITDNSNSTDYIFFRDSSNQRANYVLGSNVGGTADGLNIWDDSGQTMIVSFSKQSVRFFQKVIAPLFDVGGATFNVRSYGALGDGVTDDAVAFRQAISLASAIGGGVIVVPSSQSAYIIGSTVTLIPNMTIIGGGGFNPTIKFSGTSGVLFSFLGTAEAQPFNSRIQNVTLLNSTATTGIACRIRNFANFYLRDVIISNWSLGVWVDWGIGLYLDECQLTVCNRSVMAGGRGLLGGIRSTNSSFMDTVIINGCAFSSNQYDIVHHGSDFALGLLGVYGCSFFESSTALVSGKSENIHLTNLKNPQIIGNWFENPAPTNRAGIVLTNRDSDGSTTTLCNGGLISSNNFLFTGTSGTNGIIVERASSVVITGNTFEFAVAGGNPINLSEVTLASTVVGNTYLTYADVQGFTSPIKSASSVHQILEPSNMTSSLGTANFGGVVSIGTGFANLPYLQFGSNRSVGFFMPDVGTINWNSTGMGINQIGGLGATLDVNGTGLFRNNLDISLGVFTTPNGTAGAPTHSFRSETPLGWYRSANSTMALSYGTMDFTATVLSVGSLKVKAGANQSCGTAVLGSNGSVNVANTYVKTGDLIFLTDQTPGGTLGDLEMTGIRNSSGFTIASTSVTDTSTVAWLIIRPG